MKLFPKSRASRRRLRLVFVAAHVPPGRPIQLGGLVENGSVSRPKDGEVRFILGDHRMTTRVTYRGDLPDLFREGQGIVASGTFDAAGTFVATQILAKHDERYMPRDLARALKATGEWRGNSGVS